MKFYYNGKLVRTSKNHEYTHAVLDMTNGGCVGCRCNRDAAEAIIAGEINAYMRGIENAKTHIEAINRGAKVYKYKEGRGSCYVKTDKTVERPTKWIAYATKQIEHIENNWKVVELERRS